MEARMLSFFKTPDDAAEEVPGAASPMQPSSVPTARAKTMACERPLDSVTALAKSNGIAVVQQAARVVVVGTLLVSVLEHLPAAMRADIAASFREGIDDLLSLGDDRVLPPQFQSTLLTEFNQYLSALR
jgi:lipoate-protein ligase A